MLAITMFICVHCEHFSSFLLRPCLLLSLGLGVPDAPDLRNFFRSAKVDAMG
jgi:hypothetical protein